MKNKLKIYIKEKIAKFKIYIKFFLSVINFPWKNDDIAFLADKSVKGVIHIGAHWGGEALAYNLYQKKVMWIEAIPSVYHKLKQNIKKYPKQKALNYLITDKDHMITKFNVSNSYGGMSSIYKLGAHKKLFPNIKMVKKILLKSITLKTLINKKRIKIENYQALIIDVQGAELKVLKGIGNYLKYFKYVLLETDNCELYENSSQVKELREYMLKNNYYEKKIYISLKKNNMELYNILFKKILKNNHH